jgi:DNA polymerase-3 subunit gamma/tau
MHLTQNCQVVAVDGDTLTLGFANAGARDSFVSGGCGDVLRQAAVDVVGANWKIDTIVDPSAQAEGTPTVTKAAAATPATPGSERSDPPAPREAAPTDTAPWDPVPAPDAEATAAASAAARGAIQQTRSADQPREQSGPDWATADADAHPDDLDAEHQGVSAAELLQRELGAQMIEEIPHQ